MTFLRSFIIFTGGLLGPVDLLLSNGVIIFMISLGLVGVMNKMC